MVFGNMFFLLLLMTFLFEFCISNYVPFSILPKNYDGSFGWEHCEAFKFIFDQKTCSSCCAMALASAISARECMRDGRNILYSGQQLWDCSYGSSPTCEKGVDFSKMILELKPQMLYGSKGFIPTKCLPYDNMIGTLSSNSSRCLSTWNQANCSKETSLVYSVMANELSEVSTWGRRGQHTAINSMVAMNELMSEIMLNGPVVAILYISNKDFRIFSNWKSDAIFVPSFNNSLINNEEYERHCIMVYGWGRDENTGINYWLVQNSYGDGWGVHGKSKIVRGYNWLENEWRGISTMKRPCYEYNDTLCMSLQVHNQSVYKNILQISVEFQDFASTLKLYSYSSLAETLFYLQNQKHLVDENMNKFSIISKSNVLLITFLSSFVISLIYLYMTYQKNNLHVIEEDISLDQIARKQASQFKNLILNNYSNYIK